jgi:phosphate transport system ATP-binding protein
VSQSPVFTISNLDFFYGTKRALSRINMEILPRKVTALIGPSGCGKSTFLRCLNRMNDTIPGTHLTGEILLEGKNIYAEDYNVAELRQQVGMVFQKPNPFPQSVYDNVAFGPRVLGMVHDKSLLDSIVEQSLRDAVLWEEVKQDLKANALGFSLGQQQRICIARVLAVKPEVILFDELHHRHSDPQHAAGGTSFGLHRAILAGRTGRIWSNQEDLYPPGKRTDGCLSDR